jgi:hypothetical protein
MSNESPEQTKRTLHGHTVVTTTDRLVIRMPVVGYFVILGFYLLAVLVPWVMTETGLLGRDLLKILPPMAAAGWTPFVILLGRWWTFDRKANSIRYFPWRLCALTDVRGVRVVERHAGKRNLDRAYSIELDREGKSSVRLMGFIYAPLLGAAETLDYARAVGDWLNVPVKEEYLNPPQLVAGARDDDRIRSPAKEPFVSRFAPGQLWSYHARTGEDDSRIRILRVDATERAGVVVHVAVEGVVIVNPADPDRATRTIGFMPIAEAALDASVTQLVAEDDSFVPSADFEAGYSGWKAAFDAGKAGFWTAPVAKVVQTVDDGLRSRQS